MIKYFVIYDFKRFGEYTSIVDAQNAVKDHSEFFKSKYTKKGSPRSNFSELKRFAISDNNGQLYYIYWVWMKTVFHQKEKEID